jgi:dihydrofolate reductase
VKKILVFVSTLDGKITKWDNPKIKSWSSKSDQDYFKSLWNDSPLIIMGSETYNADPIRPSAKHLILVMTGKPLKYKSAEVPGQLEFTNESPLQLTAKFENAGIEKMVIVGGAHIATSFLKENLVDELWLTIEPKIFGKGSNFVTDEKLDIRLKLLDFERANEQGTLITKYSVIKDIK